MDGPSPRRNSVGSRHGSDSESDDLDESSAAGVGGFNAGGCGGGPSKRRRRERACDHCRSRKVKCDGAEQHDRVCTLCRTTSRPCTYVSKSNKRKNKPRPTMKTNLGLSAPSYLGEARSPGARPTLSSTKVSEKAGASTHTVAGTHEILEFRPHSHADDEHADSPASIPRAVKPYRVWMGRSSTYNSIGDAFRMAAASGYVRPPIAPATERKVEQKFGFQQPWERDEYVDRLGEITSDVWPAEDLASALIDFYFHGFNSIYPLFRKTDFLKRFRRADYSADRGFRNVCLLMFAIASSHGYDDSRCYAPNLSSDAYTQPLHPRQSSGWIYYHQATRYPRRHTQASDASDLHLAVLSTAFLVRSSNPLVCGSVTGEGVIRAYELGAHRGGTGQDATENDTLRRAFWCLFILDVQMSAGLGRSPSIAPATFDTPLPEAVGTGTDEDLTAFYHTVKFAHLSRTTLNSLYGLDSHSKSKLWVVQQMAALNQEADALQRDFPESLRWDPDETDEIVLEKAVALQLFVQHVLLLINRPALPNWRTPKAPVISTTSFDVALAAAHKSVLIYHHRLVMGDGLPSFLVTCQDAASTLAVVLFGGKSAGVVVHEPSIVKAMQNCWRSLQEGKKYSANMTPSSGWIMMLLAMRDAVPPEASQPRPFELGLATDEAPPNAAAPLPALSGTSYPHAAPAPAAQPPAALFGGPYTAPACSMDFFGMYPQFSLESLGFGLGMDEQGYSFDFEMGDRLGGGGAEGGGGVGGPLLQD